MTLPRNLLTYAAVFGAGIAVYSFIFLQSDIPQNERRESAGFPESQPAPVTIGPNVTEPGTPSKDPILTSSEMAAKIDALLRVKGSGAGLAMEEFADSLSPAQCRAALDAVVKRNHRGNDYLLLRALARRWAESTPSEAANYARTLRTQHARSHAVSAVIENWGETDFAAATQWLASLPRGGERAAFQAVLARQIAHADPVQALALIEQSPELLRAGAQMGVYADWAARDPAAAAQHVVNMSPGRFRHQAIESIAKTWAQQDPFAAVEWFIQLPEEAMHWPAMHAILDKLPFQSGATTERIFDAIENLETRRMVASRLARPWAQADPEAARKWAEALPDGKVRDEALAAVIVTWGEQNARGAADYTATLPPGDAQVQALTGILAGWIKSDVNAAIAWADSLPEGVLREKALEGAATRTSHNNPALAIELIALMPPGQKQEERIRYASNQMAAHDLDAAVAWATQQTNPEVSAAVWRGIVSAASLSHPSAMEDLLYRMPAAARDASSREIAAWKFQKDPHAAAVWTMTIPDAVRRGEALEFVLRRWTERDNDAARAWVASSSLPGDVKARYLSKPGTAQSRP